MWCLLNVTNIKGSMNWNIICFIRLIITPKWMSFGGSNAMRSPSYYWLMTSNQVTLKWMPCDSHASKSDNKMKSYGDISLVLSGFLKDALYILCFSGKAIEHNHWCIYCGTVGFFLWLQLRLSKICTIFILSGPGHFSA